MDYFADANAKIAALDAKVTALETAAPVDLSGLQADVDAIKTAIASLDARLDAIASGAQG